MQYFIYITFVSTRDYIAETVQEAEREYQQQLQQAQTEREAAQATIRAQQAKAVEVYLHFLIETKKIFSHFIIIKGSLQEARGI